jgi:hypothetical protein
MPVPSLKASMFQFIADELQKLVSSGRLSQTELERRLDPDDRKYLGKTLATSSWVPIATSSRVLKLLFDLDGGSDIRIFMRERGRANALKLKDGGIYGQFDAAAAVSESLQRAGKIAITLSALMFNFSRWRFEAGAEDEDVLFRIVIEDAEAYPDLNRFAAEGFIEQLTAGLPQAPKVSVHSERPSPDRVVFTAVERS